MTVQKLCVAIAQQSADKLFRKWDERSASAWRKYVDVAFLSDAKEHKVANDGLVVARARLPGTLVFAANHLTTRDATRGLPNVIRLQSYKLEAEIDRWIVDNGLDWRHRTRVHCEKTPFIHISPDEWVNQFARVDPERGRRAGAALLAQFRIVGPGELATFFDDLPDVDIHALFNGADPHSGDFALVSVLSARVKNSTLKECMDLPHLKNGNTVRLYADGSWSGGETQRRISCMYIQCEKKAVALEKSHNLEVHAAFVTDTAKNVVTRAIDRLVRDDVTRAGAVKLTHPPENYLTVRGVKTGQKGLAFQDPELLRYVDPKNLRTLRRLCRSIGERSPQESALGTSDIASCIGFAHSLPAAMLPVFRLGGFKVEDSSGKPFTWQSLIHSEHAVAGEDDSPGYHCSSCPLGDRGADEAEVAPMVAAAPGNAVQQ